MYLFASTSSFIRENHREKKVERRILLTWYKDLDSTEPEETICVYICIPVTSVLIGHSYTMTPDITTTVSVDIRVPPMFITDAAILDNFPELFYSSPERQASHSSISHDNTRKSSHKKTVNKDARLFIDSTHTEGFINDDSSEDSPTCEGGDLFDSTYVLPDNCQWWQQVGEHSFEAPPSDFEVVDLPHFGYDLNYSSLWEDVDTFVSVVDVTDDDVTEERAVYEPVYCLDTRRTTVWGLDIIWEEDEEYL